MDKINIFEFFTFKKCPNCQNEWKRKYIKNEETKEITIQYSNVHRREEINQLNKQLYIIFRCLKCFKEFAEIQKIMSEKEFDEINKIKNEELNKIEPIVIKNIDPAKLFDDDEMMKLIGM